MDNKQDKDVVEYIQTIVNAAYDRDVVLTKFLTPYEQKTLSSMIGNNFHLRFFGGYENANLKRALISSFDISNANLKLKVIKLKAMSKFYHLKHPTVKWHFYNMGINERMFGDIVAVDDYFIVVIADEVFDVVMSETTKINRCPVEYQIVETVEILNDKEEYVVYCSSLRLDNVCAKAFHVSRGKLQTFIKNDRVKVNGIIINKNQYAVKIDDTITIQKVGKIIIKKIDVNNRSGKYIVYHNRFLRK